MWMTLQHPNDDHLDVRILSEKDSCPPSLMAAIANRKLTKLVSVN